MIWNSLFTTQVPISQSINKF